MVTATRMRRTSPGIARSTLPLNPKPMLCTLIDKPFDDPGWLFEPKLDGVRVLARFDGRRVSLLSRNQLSQNFVFPDVVAALRDSLKCTAIVDGEIVCMDERGLPSFHLLAHRLHLTNKREVKVRVHQYPAYLFLFDVLHANGSDVTSFPLAQRKEILGEIMDWTEQIRWTDGEPEHGMRMWRDACRHGGEGIVGKRLDSRYVQARSAAWVKIKCLLRQEFVIGGFSEPQRSRIGFGALLIGYYGKDGQGLHYAGKVGTGFSDEILHDLRRRLAKLTQRGCPFATAVSSKDAPGRVHWVAPELVAEIAFSEWSPHGRLRHPRFEGLRFDKKPRDCRREKPVRV